jgi:hypothetical protein
MKILKNKENKEKLTSNLASKTLTKSKVDVLYMGAILSTPTSCKI